MNLRSWIRDIKREDSDMTVEQPDFGKWLEHHIRVHTRELGWEKFESFASETTLTAEELFNICKGEASPPNELLRKLNIGSTTKRVRRMAEFDVPCYYPLD